MPFLKWAADWIGAHQKEFGFVVSIVAALGGAWMWFDKYRLTRDQRRKLKQDSEIQSFAEAILIWTDAQKERQGTLNLIFPDEALRELLRKDGDRLHIAMNYLVDKKLAKRTAPGYWSIRYEQTK